MTEQDYEAHCAKCGQTLPALIQRTVQTGPQQYQKANVRPGTGLLRPLVHLPENVPGDAGIAYDLQSRMQRAGRPLCLHCMQEALDLIERWMAAGSETLDQFLERWDITVQEGIE